MESETLKKPPFEQDIESKKILKKLTSAHRALAELKGIVSRITAAKYLNRLAKDGLLKKERLGTGNYYVNEKLIKTLTLKK